MNIRKNISLAPYTSFKIGGPARFFSETNDKDELIECLKFANKANLKIFFLGNGSNILVSDGGFNGLVIKLANDTLKWEGDSCATGAGITLLNLIGEAKRRALGGMEWAYGIPATIGGSIHNNAGAFGKNIASHITAISYFDTKTNNFVQIAAKNCNFGYRDSIFKKKPAWIVWEAELKWQRKNPQKIQEEIDFFASERRTKQPLNYPSAGSFFRNPSIKNLPKKKKLAMIEQFAKKMIKGSPHGQETKTKIREKIENNQSLPAGYFIERAGLKGKKIGGAEVSEKHANFIINTGNAKAEDVIILSGIIKQKVRNKFGVQLYEEVEYVGF